MTASIESMAAVRLQESPHLELHQLRCTFCHGILTLSGMVSNYQVRQIAQELIQDLEGIKVIDNQLVVVNDQVTTLAG